MHIISRKTLRQAGRIYPDLAEPLNDWFTVANKAKWRHIEDVREVYPEADKVGDCTVFNIKGKKYRLVVKIRYQKQRIYIIGIMPHAEYTRDKWKDDC